MLVINITRWYTRIDLRKDQSSITWHGMASRYNIMGAAVTFTRRAILPLLWMPKSAAYVCHITTWSIRKGAGSLTKLGQTQAQISSHIDHLCINSHTLLTSEHHTAGSRQIKSVLLENHDARSSLYQFKFSTYKHDPKSGCQLDRCTWCWRRCKGVPVCIRWSSWEVRGTKGRNPDQT